MMKIYELGRFDIPEKILEAWSREMGDELLPVQERAIRFYNVLNGTSLLISSPVTSGMTFLGEIAAVKGALERKKVVCLVSQWSVAEEMYINFRKKYEPFGIQTTISSRNHHEYDCLIETGKFGIAVIEFEKMAQLLVKNPLLLRNIDKVIIDDLQQIENSDRGPGLEITLTKIATSPDRPQIIGFSDVLDNAGSLARWLGTDLLSHVRRSVELYRGAVYKAAFQYGARDTLLEERTEAVTGMASDDSADILLANIIHLIEKGDQILIVLPSRIDTMVFARILADRVNLPSASGALGDISSLEETCLKKGLAHCLQKSIAFHHEDLSREKRNIVERHARTGDIKVIFCTPAMAMGLNLPATTIVLHTHKRESDGCNHVTLTPIGWAEYENIGGNGLRHGFGWGSGRPVTIAGNDYEHRILWEHHSGEEARMPASHLNGRGLENHIMNIVASGLARNREDIETFLSRTLMGLSENREVIRENLEKAFRFLLDNKFIEEDHKDGIKVSSLGTVVALKGVTCLTAMELASFFREAGDRELTNLEILDAVASSDDGKRVYIRAAQEEHRSGKYDQFMSEIFDSRQEYMGTLFSYVVKSPLLITPDKARNRKQILLLDRWIQAKETPSLERDFESYHNATARVAEGMSWIMDAALLIAQSAGSPKSLQDRLSILSERLLYGVEESGLELARLRVSGLGRAGIKKLVRKGFTNRKRIRKTPVTILSSMIPENVAKELKRVVEQEKDSSPETTVVEKFLPDDTFLCRDRIKITGKPEEKRNLVMINGSPTAITNRSLELLLRFAVALKKDGCGWVHREDFASGVETTQFISRLRNEIRSLTLAKDGTIIENDGSGSYRLSIPPQNVVIDTESLMMHWNAVINDMVSSISE
jgi:helicase